MDWFSFVCMIRQGFRQNAPQQMQIGSDGSNQSEEKLWTGRRRRFGNGVFMQERRILARVGRRIFGTQRPADETSFRVSSTSADPSRHVPEYKVNRSLRIGNSVQATKFTRPIIGTNVICRYKDFYKATVSVLWPLTDGVG